MWDGENYSKVHRVKTFFVRVFQEGIALEDGHLHVDPGKELPDGGDFVHPVPARLFGRLGDVFRAKVLG